MRCDCLQGCLRVECFGRDHDGGAVRHRREIGHDTPEAVVKRHRDADAIRFGVFQDLAHEETIVQDVVMRKRRTFRRSRGARCVLDIDWIIELEHAFACCEGRVINAVPPGDEIAPRHRAGA